MDDDAREPSAEAMNAAREVVGNSTVAYPFLIDRFATAIDAAVRARDEKWRACFWRDESGWAVDMEAAGALLDTPAPPAADDTQEKP